MFYLSPLAALGYVIAYLLFLWVLGFMDAFQHSYDIHYRLLDAQQKPTRDRHYEEQQYLQQFVVQPLSAGSTCWC